MTGRRGIIAALLRERHPFAALAILAMLLPAILPAIPTAGLAGAGAFGGGLRLADGSLVICTGSGFERVADAEPDTDPDAHPDFPEHRDPAACCAPGCVGAIARTAIAPVPATVPARIAAVAAIAWPPSDGSSLAILSATARSIRAPPALSA